MRLKFSFSNILNLNFREVPRLFQGIVPPWVRRPCLGICVFYNTHRDIAKLGKRYRLREGSYSRSKENDTYSFLLLEVTSYSLFYPTLCVIFTILVSFSQDKAKNQRFLKFLRTKGPAESEKTFQKTLILVLEVIV